MRNRYNRSLTLHGIKHTYRNIEFNVIKFNGAVYITDANDKEAKNAIDDWLYNGRSMAVGYNLYGLRVIHNGLERAMVITFICKENNIKALMESFKQKCGENSEWTIINT